MKDFTNTLKMLLIANQANTLLYEVFLPNTFPFSPLKSMFLSEYLYFSKGAIKIIEGHFDKFSDYIKEDYDYWYVTLNGFLNHGKEDSIAARNALNAFYPQMAKLLIEDSNENRIILKVINIGKNSNYTISKFSEIVFKFESIISQISRYLQFFLEALRNDMLKNTKYNTELAVKNFIYFAEPCKQQKQKDLLNDMFNLTVCLLENYCSR